MIEDLDPEVREYDPWSALDGGSDGLDVYRELVRDLVRVVPDGWAVFEVGKGQASAVSELLTFARIGAQSPEIRTFRDLNGVDRCVAWRARN
jgi:release factor glutamine methyltransferase